MTFDINRDLAEDAAEDYSDDVGARKEFAAGWYAYCCDERINLDNIGLPCVADIHWIAGYIAARDAPD